MIRIFFPLFLLVTLTLPAVAQDTLIVNFKFDSDVVSKNDKLKIIRFKDKHQNAHFSFFGYCDTSGSFIYNIDLATRRISSVKEIMNDVKLNTETPVGESSEFTVMGKNRAVRIIANDPVIESEQKMASSSVIIGNKEVLDTIRLKLEFWGGTPDLKEYSIPELYKLYAKISEAADVNVEIHGHVCCDDDMGLSIRRAQRVYDYLISKGIDKSRLSYEGHSNYQPRVPEISEENMQMNRRVEVVLYRKLKLD